MMITIEQRLERLAISPLPRILMISHGIGGGVARHIDELTELLHGRAHVLLLEPMTERRLLRLTLPVLDENGAPEASATFSLAYAWPKDAELLWQLIKWLGIGRIHIHHGQGFAPDFWLQLQRQAIEYDLTLHDHSIFTGHASLVNNKGVFNQQWLAEEISSLPQGNQKLAQSLQDLALHAQRIIVPSAQLLQAVHTLLPHLAQHQCLIHRAHPDGEDAKAYPQPSFQPLLKQEPMRVLCLGMLSIEKGAGVLALVAEQAQAVVAPLEFVLLGSCHVPLPASVERLGSYDDRDVQALITQINPHLIWLPAQCPETWSYTLSVAFKAGLPVLTSDLGVFPERLKGRPLSWLCQHNSTPERWLQQLSMIRAAHLSEDTVGFWSWLPPPVFYLNTSSTQLQNAYWLATDAQLSAGLPNALQQSLKKAHSRATQGTALWRTAVLTMLALLRDSRWFLPLVRIVPYTWQQKIKRMITREPLSERRKHR